MRPLLRSLRCACAVFLLLLHVLLAAAADDIIAHQPGRELMLSFSTITNSIQDISGNGYIASKEGGGDSSIEFDTVLNTLVFTNALHPTASYDGVIVTNYDVFGPSTTTCIWLNVVATALSIGDYYTLASFRKVGGGKGWTLVMTKGGTLYTYVFFDDIGIQTSITTYDTTTFSYNVAAWTQVCVTFDLFAAQLQVFVGGIGLAALTTVDTNNQRPRLVADGSLILQFAGSGQGSFGFQGSWTDARHYSYILTSAQIKNMYFKGAADQTLLLEPPPTTPAPFTDASSSSSTGQDQQSTPTPTDQSGTIVITVLDTSTSSSEADALLLQQQQTVAVIVALSASMTTAMVALLIVVCIRRRRRKTRTASLLLLQHVKGRIRTSTSTRDEELANLLT
jgi:hypothetical protein